MKTRVAVLLASLLICGSLCFAQAHAEVKAPVAQPSCGLERSDLEDELKDLGVYMSRMQSRIIMIRNSAGIVQNSEVRNALQVDADMWQDLLDHLKQRSTRLETAIDRCKAREKINSNTK